MIMCLLSFLQYTHACPVFCSEYIVGSVTGPHHRCASTPYRNPLFFPAGRPFFGRPAAKNFQKVYTCVYMYTSMYTCTCTRVCMYVYIYVYMYTHVYMNTYTRVCMCTCPHRYIVVSVTEPHHTIVHTPWCKPDFGRRGPPFFLAGPPPNFSKSIYLCACVYTFVHVCPIGV